MRQLISSTGLPFLPTPMGKGVVSDLDARSVAPARSLVLREADVILLLGARLNWMLHFGLPPRFAEDVRIIQVDICPEELGNSRRPDVALFGDVSLTVEELLRGLGGHRVNPRTHPWWLKLSENIRANRLSTEELSSDESIPLNYYAVFKHVRELMPPEAFVVSEGANTMDIGRGFLDNGMPRKRLDAGSFGTMGVGLGFAIAAALVNKSDRVVCVEGDSAFGFSGMEVETMVRYQVSKNVSDLCYVYVSQNSNTSTQSFMHTHRSSTATYRDVKKYPEFENPHPSYASVDWRCGLLGAPSTSV